MAQSLSQALEGAPIPDNAYLSGAEKKEWCAQRIPFFITGIARDDDNKFGPRWVVTVVTTDEERRRIALGQNDTRDGVLSHLTSKLANGPIGPSFLWDGDATDGKGAWRFEDVPAVPVPAVPVIPVPAVPVVPVDAEVPPAQAIDAEDIPF